MNGELMSKEESVALKSEERQKTGSSSVKANVSFFIFF